MINVYDSKETNFNHNGLVVLSDTISSPITEELNGSYEVELEYPFDARGKWKYLLEGNIIKVDGQLFRIYHKFKNLASIKLNARHIFYDLLDNLLEDVRPTDLTGYAALDWILNRTQYTHTFTSMGDVGGTNTRYFIRVNPVDAIMGKDGIINTWGGELVRDNFTIKLLQARGLDRGVLIAYGKNIQGIEETLDIDGICTRLMPIGKNGLLLSEKYIDSPYINNFPHPKIRVVEFSDCEDEASLRTAAQKYMLDNKIDIPKFNYKIDFIELSKTEEYKHYAVLETVYLGDTVTIKHNKLGINLKAKVIKTIKNPLTNRLEKIELGSFKANIANSINTSIQSVKNEIIQVKSDYQKAIDNATALITGSKGGNVVIRQDENKHPYEILIMDTTDVNTAGNVWRWNMGGFGHSSTGINGPYDTAITQDGHIVGTFITALVIAGEQIKTGIITSIDGKVSIGIDDGSGVNVIGGALTLKNGNNEVIIDGQHNMHKIIITGFTTITLAPGEYSKWATINHNLGYVPAFSAYVYSDFNNVYSPVPYTPLGQNLGTGELVLGESVEARISSTKLEFVYMRNNTFINSTFTVNIKYFIYKEVAF
ncbi:phage tail spike protein [Clostridium omnivorum]|uniref:Prophage tail endopeptidase domain-containing protein n=1 Tax=Clostridium omnivorum TaxID=1604902 RepID=A0ABQ5NCH6_9CLOT|nr:phage tail spike protein [Clostridium sp. E14]GLC32926.1 hypothetical protein bsdE14_43360 [Clostridium sp. E14]